MARKRKRRHDIPIGTKISVYGEPYIVVVDNYQTILECEPDCAEDHDHFTEPHICVRKQSWTTVPLKSVAYVFDQPNGVGRKYKP